MNKYLLGIDNGGTMVKASLFDSQGSEIAVACSKVKVHMPHPGFIERNMNELWDTNAKVIKDLILKAGIDPGLIVGVGVTGHGNGIYLIDENGKPVCNGINSADSRANDIVAKWHEDGIYDRVHPKIMQEIWAGQPVALLAWMKKNTPDVVTKTKWILMCKDYIRFCLTGAAYAEITDLSGTNLMNVRDARYDIELLKEFGLEDIIDKLPPIKYSSEICGYVTPEAERQTGLKAGTPVAGGLFDIDACAIATGLFDEEKACIVAGSWSINQYIIKDAIVSKDMFLNTLYCIKGYRLVTEASPTSASNLEWFVEQFFCAEEKAAEERCVPVYKICDEIVSKIQPEESNIIFLPFLFGTNVEADAKASFIGIKGWHTRDHLLRSVFEGVVFGHLYHFNRLLAYRPKPEAIRISGGASRSRVWVQIFADAFQIPIEVVRGSELGALGAAICAGVATNVFESFKTAAEGMVEISYTCMPNPDKKEIYEKKYSNYLNIIKQLAPVWKNL